jgi:hypothetical protein
MKEAKAARNRRSGERPGRPQGTVAKRYDVTVRRYAGLYKLAARVARAHGEVRIDSELRAYAIAVDAMADFLHENRAKPAIILWLKGLVNALADLDHGAVPSLLRPVKARDKSLSTNEWRRFAAISAGMRALTMCGVSRDGAADQALRAVKAIQNFEKSVVLSRYEEFRKQRVKNKTATADYVRSCKALEGQPPDKLRQIASALFIIADLLA